MKRLILLFIVNCARVALIAPLLMSNARDCFSQSITWQRTYQDPFNGESIAYDVCQANGDNYYLVGYVQHSPYGTITISVLKINKYGDTLWSRFIDSVGRAYAAVSSGDGGCVLTGATGFTIKIDSLGNIIWHKSYGQINARCLDIIKTSDGGYLACGFRVSSAYDGYILRINSNGDLQWQFILPATGQRFLNSVLEAIDGGYVFAGSFSAVLNAPPSAYILKMDINHNVIWERTFEVNNSGSVATKMTKSNNWYLLSGNTAISELVDNVFLARLNLQGDTTFVKSFFSTFDESMALMEFVNANKYVITSSKDTLYPYPQIVKIRLVDSLGNELRQKNYYSLEFYQGLGIYSIHRVSENDFLFAGVRDSNYLADMYALRTDTLLEAPPINIIKENEQLPIDFQLKIYPNPFNSSTNIRFQVPEMSNVSLKIYDISGKEITIVTEGMFNTGTYEVKWDAENYASGIYFVSLFTNDRLVLTRKIVLLK